MPPLPPWFLLFLSTVAGTPTNVQHLCNVVVWLPPDKPNGVVLSYQIEFSNGQSGLPPHRDVPNTGFYLTSPNEAGMMARVSTKCKVGVILQHYLCCLFR